MNAPTLELAFAGIRRLRPPKLELQLDAMILNRASDFRWVLLPSTAGPSRRVERRLHTVERYELAGSGRIVVAAFRGEGALWAIEAPAAAELRLAGLPIAWWGAEPETLELEVSTATALVVDGRPLSQWFRSPPASDRKASVDASPLADQMAVVESIGGGGAGAALTVDVLDEHFEHIVVPLSGGLVPHSTGR